MAGIQPILDYLNAGGVLALMLIIGFGFYTGRFRLGKDYNEQEQELDECRAEIKQLWIEKVEDKEKAAALADAYLKIRESDKA